MQSEFSHLMMLGVPQKLELIGALWQSIENGQQIPVSDALVSRA